MPASAPQGRREKPLERGSYAMVRTIVGANWGDEGKGKITDVLAENSDVVVRFQGGANAGHTLSMIMENLPSTCCPQACFTKYRQHHRPGRGFGY